MWLMSCFSVSASPLVPPGPVQQQVFSSQHPVERSNTQRSLQPCGIWCFRRPVSFVSYKTASVVARDGCVRFRERDERQLVARVSACWSHTVPLLLSETRRRSQGMYVAFFLNCWTPSDVFVGFISLRLIEKRFPEHWLFTWISAELINSFLSEINRFRDACLITRAFTRPIYFFPILSYFCKFVL